ITASAGEGFTSRVITAPDGDILEDRIAEGVGSYSASAAISPGDWIMQMVAFKPASFAGSTAVPDLPPASTLSNTLPSSSPPGTPTLVQHVAGAMDNNFVTTLTLTLPNPAGAGNALILGVRFNAAGSVSSVSDDQGNAWMIGPTTANENVPIPNRMTLYYALNVAAGTQTITVTFDGLDGPGGHYGFPQAVASEFYNVATVSAFDGMSGSATSTTAGSFTTTSPGDLIYEWGIDASAVDATAGGQFNGSSITAGPGFTLLSADLQVGSA